jgi:putative phosphoribosyl transferase
MVFADRVDAGRRLATALSDLVGDAESIVLGIPRGGVVVAAEIARVLRLPLDVFLARKLGVPGQEELAFGAVTADGARYLDEEIVRAARLSEAEVDRITHANRALLAEQARIYRAGRLPLQLVGKKAIMVDDGIATGASAYASVQAIRTLNPAQTILAVPVAPPSTSAWLQKCVDRFVCLDIPRDFQAVGQFYSRFAQVSDAEVIELLANHQ